MVTRSPGETLTHAISTLSYAEASTGTVPANDTGKQLGYAELGAVGTLANDWQWEILATQ